MHSWQKFWISFFEQFKFLQYADLNYEGNGLSEYMIYNTKNKSWDKTACKAGSSKRCVKMDCHNQVRIAGIDDYLS